MVIKEEININKIKTIITLGPSTRSEKSLRMIKDKGVDFVRVNMSHSTFDDLEHFLRMSKLVDIPFIIDTEGSQIRTGGLEEELIHFEENTKVSIFINSIIGNNKKICLQPGEIIKNINEGDLLHIDFDALILRIIDTSKIDEGYVVATVENSGTLGQNKAVVINPRFKKYIDPPPPLTEKDMKAIKLGLDMGVKHIAVSFVRNGESVDMVRQFTRDKMDIISKVECLDALNNLDDIIDKSDFILLDRGDLS